MRVILLRVLMSARLSVDGNEEEQTARHIGIGMQITDSEASSSHASSKRGKERPLSLLNVSVPVHVNLQQSLNI